MFELMAKIEIRGWAAAAIRSKSLCPESMDRQLTMAGCDDRRTLPFHKAVLNGELPYTIGGGIGQSRLCMLLLGSVHIGEVQASVWDKATREACAKAGIPLL